MFSLVMTVKLISPLVPRLVMTWPGVGDVKVDVGGVASTTNGTWALGSAGLDWLPLWSMTRTRAT